MPFNRLRSIFILFFLFQTTVFADAPAPFLADVESFVIRSSEHKQERDFQISVALPSDYKTSDKNYPILYSLDANGEFGIVASTARILEGDIPGIIVVGIGYPTGGRFIHAIKYRTWDYTPTRDLEEEKAGDLPDILVPAGTGAAPEFLQFIRQQLIPEIEKKYRVDSSDRALLGHSLGGLFSSYALLHNQGLFQRFVIGSPSLWWDERVMFKLEEKYAATNKALPVRAFLSAGGKDTDRVKAAFEDFVAVLEKRQYADFDWEWHIFPGETHMSVVPATVSRGLRSIYKTAE